ncbi:MAG: tRNA (N6-isopentenyl adenosine(37)-C2)-methylthiotransferase MiaB [Salibacteraceae bacterium]
MEDLLGQNKVIDENRQGEATMMDTVDSNSKKKMYIENYGCQMNFSDSEIVASILTKEGYETTNVETDADLILVNTCSIRENAETRVMNRLGHFKKNKRQNPGLIIGVLGCMAERMRETLLEKEKLVDIVAGPDAYRNLPGLIEEASEGRKAVNVLLSREETYAEISPVRLSSNGVTAFISIMRGCDNMCSFCVVPFTRGRERSRNPETIVKEAQELFDQGFREVTLLGQNVDSYRWNMSSKGVIKDENAPTVNFAGLMDMVAKVNPKLRIRFSTSHPKDMTNEVLEVMAKHHNICKYIHLPVQSGNTEILEKMNRGYTREWYLERIASINRIMPDCAISTDIITGFCSETEEQHKDTVSLMKEVDYDFAFMFKYSERPRTLAERKFEDDVKEEDKAKRLDEVIAVQQVSSLKRNKNHVGKTFEVLVEGLSKRSDKHVFGRTTQNAVVIFEKGDLQPGDYVNVNITDCSSATLQGKVVN